MGTNADRMPEGTPIDQALPWMELDQSWGCAPAEAIGELFLLKCAVWASTITILGKRFRSTAMITAGAPGWGVEPCESSGFGANLGIIGTSALASIKGICTSMRSLHRTNSRSLMKHHTQARGDFYGPDDARAAENHEADYPV